MRISRITVWQLDLPLSQPYFPSGGSCGLTGWTAACPIDTDAGSAAGARPARGATISRHGPGVRAGIETMAPALIGIDPRGIDHLNAVMDVTLPGTMQSAIDIAAWDVFGQAAACRLAMSRRGGRYGTGGARTGGGQFLDLHRLA